MGLGCLTWLPLPVVFGGGGLLAVLAAFVASIAAVVFGGTFLTCCGGGLVLLAIDRATSSVQSVEVVAHAWERKIYIEEVVVKEDDGWCHSMPDGAIETDRREKFHHREKRVGRDRSIYEDWCEYRIAEWDRVDPLQRTGDDTKPAWPELEPTGCTKVGCRKETRRAETLEVEFDRPSKHSGPPWRCKMDNESDWLSWGTGDRATLLVGGVVGAPYCDQLVRVGTARRPPASSPKPEPKPGPKPTPRKRKKKPRRNR
jgi:hypothetical protein